jgi:hypothetical protein
MMTHDRESALQIRDEDGENHPHTLPRVLAT